MLAPLWAQAPAATEVLRARSAACGMMGVSVKVTREGVAALALLSFTFFKHDFTNLPITSVPAGAVGLSGAFSHMFICSLHNL